MKGQLRQRRDDRRPEYLFRDPVGGLIYVSAAKMNFSYDESFQFFFAIEGGVSVAKIPIKEVKRYLGGGTTFITLFGELYVPAPHEKKAATWRPKILGEDSKPVRKLKKLDPDQFDIDEFAGGIVRIRRK